MQFYNEILWFQFALVDFLAATLLFCFFKKEGLYAIIVMNIILCNIQVAKTVEMFGVVTTLGNILYGTIFFSTDALSELYGRKEAKRGVWVGFAVLVLASAYMRIAILFKPHQSDFIQPHLAAIFKFFPRIAAASLSAYLISQLHDVWAFHFWKRLTKSRFLWLRNNASTLVSQLIDSVVFCLLAFYGVFEHKILLQITLTTYLIKLIIAIMDTPFIYLICKIARRTDAREII